MATMTREQAVERLAAKAKEAREFANTLGMDGDDCWREYAENADLFDLAIAALGGGEVVAWEHTLTVEGQPMSRLSYSKTHPFGRRGVNYDPTGKITSRALSALPPSPQGD